MIKEWKPARSGVVVVDIESGSAADEAGIKSSDIILQVDDVNVRSSDDVLKAVNKSKDLFILIKLERLMPKRRASAVTVSPAYRQSFFRWSIYLFVAFCSIYRCARRL